jgi:hypothetical protein
MDPTKNQGRYQRLQRELAEAYAADVCHNGLIERLTEELAAMRRACPRQDADEQSSDSTVPGVLG